MGFFSSSKPDLPPNLPTFDEGAVVHATFKTSEGDFKAKLHAAECSITVGNFVGLATGQIPWTDPNTGEPAGRPLYDGTIFHRVIKDFMLQGGDPLGRGTGGPGGPLPRRVRPKPQARQAWNSLHGKRRPNTNGSQFFVCEVATPWLDGRHSVFGEVVEGMDVVLKIAQTPTGAQDRPQEDIVINTIEIDIKQRLA